MRIQGKAKGATHSRSRPFGIPDSNSNLPSTPESRIPLLHSALGRISPLISRRVRISGNPRHNTRDARRTFDSFFSQRESMERRRVRGRSPRALRLLVLAILTLGLAQPAFGQGSPSTPWSAGIDAMIANPSRLTSPFLLGVSASRMVVSGSLVGLRVDLAAAHAFAPDHMVCTLGLGPCDMRQISSVGTLTTSLTVGPAAADRSRRWMYGLLSAGAYGTLWSYGGSGPAPSGLALGAGLGVWIPGTSRPLRFESRYLRLNHDGSFVLTAGLQYAW